MSSTLHIEVFKPYDKYNTGIRAHDEYGRYEGHIHPFWAHKSVGDAHGAVYKLWTVANANMLAYDTIMRHIGGEKCVYIRPGESYDSPILVMTAKGIDKSTNEIIEEDFETTLKRT